MMDFLQADALISSLKLVRSSIQQRCVAAASSPTMQSRASGIAIKNLLFRFNGQNRVSLAKNIRVDQPKLRIDGVHIISSNSLILPKAGVFR